MNKKIGLLTVGLALLLLAVGFTGCTQGSAVTGTIPAGLKLSVSGQQEGIWVSGTGKVSVVPDVAALRLGIQAQSTSVADAQAQASVAMDAVMKALTNSGVARKDIQTQFFNISRITRWDEKSQQEVVIGYRVTNMVIAQIRMMDKVGAIIDAVAIAGGDLTRIEGVSFSVEDPTPFQTAARQKAMADAEAKAKQMAELSGVKLGKPTYISESSYSPGPVYRQGFLDKAAAPAMETPIAPGELDLTVNVQVVYSILN